MTQPYEITRSRGVASLLLIFHSGAWDNLPFEIRLLRAWYGTEFLERAGLTQGQCLDVSRRGYSVVTGSRDQSSVMKRSAGHGRVDGRRVIEQNVNMIMRGDPVPSGHTWRQQTLDKLMKARVDVRVWCEGCDHEANHSPSWAANAAGLPFNTTLYEIAQLLVCSQCGSRRVGIETAPDK